MIGPGRGDSPGRFCWEIRWQFLEMAPIWGSCSWELPPHSRNVSASVRKSIVKQPPSHILMVYNSHPFMTKGSWFPVAFSKPHLFVSAGAELPDDAGAGAGLRSSSRCRSQIFGRVVALLVKKWLPGRLLDISDRLYVVIRCHKMF